MFIAAKKGPEIGQSESWTLSVNDKTRFFSLWEGIIQNNYRCNCAKLTADYLLCWISLMWKGTRGQIVRHIVLILSLFDEKTPRRSLPASFSARFPHRLLLCPPPKNTILVQINKETQGMFSQKFFEQFVIVSFVNKYLQLSVLNMRLDF